MTTVFATIISDDGWKQKLALPLMRSSRYFHPEIPFRIFDLEHIMTLDSQYYHGIMDAKAILGEHLSKEFEHVVIFDADQILSATLTELLTEYYDVAAPRNRSDHHSVHMESNLDLFQVAGQVSKADYCNAGIISCRKPSFFTEWKLLNQQVRRFDLDQGTFNMLAYNGHYQMKMLDPPESPYYYGVANSWGQVTPWDSWKNITLEDGKLYLSNIYNQIKQVKVLHKAGSGRMAEATEKFTRDLFQPEVYDFLIAIST